MHREGMTMLGQIYIVFVYVFLLFLTEHSSQLYVGYRNGSIKPTESKG